VLPAENRQARRFQFSLAFAWLAIFFVFLLDTVPLCSAKHFLQVFSAEVCFIFHFLLFAGLPPPFIVCLARGSMALSPPFGFCSHYEFILLALTLFTSTKVLAGAEWEDFFVAFNSPESASFIS
jgi:hypothetical protein